MPQTSLFGPSWQGSLRDLANIVQQVRRMRVFGRLTLRNAERFSIVHLYFRVGKLTQVVGNRGDAHVILNELCQWTHAFIHFDRGLTVEDEVIGSEYEQFLDEVLVHLYHQGLVVLPQLPKVIDSSIISAESKPLITPGEWQILLEGTRRISLAVAQLVGPQEGLSVLRDLLADCAQAFPAFASLQIATNGYLQVVDRTILERLSREDLLEGFTALFATCQYVCAPIVGEKEAHLLMIQALQDVGPVLVNMGVFHVDSQLLSNSSSS